MSHLFTGRSFSILCFQKTILFLEEKGEEDEPLMNMTRKATKNCKVYSDVDTEKKPNLQMDVMNENEDSKEHQSTKASIRNYPKGVFFCLGNEFSERFSFYGMRAILTLYLISIHNMPDSEAKLIFHAFVSLAYFTPILGSILADGFLGRYHVILYISILYCLGHVLLTIGAVPTLPREILQILDFVGLFVIAVATGGIKPCVSAFAADQFPSNLVNERKQFFSFFYFTINLGALLSKIVTPYLRGRVHCFGNDSCFPLAFGVPAIFMVVALIIFVCGKPFYKIVKCEENIIWNVCKCCFYSLKESLKAKCKLSLRFAEPKFGTQLVDDIRGLGVILVLFLPVIPFWALFDQMGSTWVIQANRMDGRLGCLTVLPDQMSVLNPLLVIIMVPIIEMFVYPFLAKFNVLVKPLRRMGWGGLLAAVSFIIAGFLQLAINKTIVEIPANGKVHYTLANYGICPLSASSTNVNITLASRDNYMDNFDKNVEFNFDCVNSLLPSNINKNWTSPNDGHFLVFWDRPTADVNYGHVPFELKKTKNGKSRIYIQLHPDYMDQNASIIVMQDGVVKFSQTSGSKYVDIEPGLVGSNVYDIMLKTCNGCQMTFIQKFEAKAGAAHGIVYMNNATYSTLELIAPNTISLMWQIPQYLIITTGEILFSISGLEFSYSQAAPSMKSVLQAIWLMTVAFGNVVDMIISGSSIIEDPAIEFFVYACLMFIVMIVFVFLAYRYKYVDRDTNSETVDNVDNKSGLLKKSEITKNYSNEETKT